MQRNFFSQIKDKMLEGRNLLNPQMPDGKEGRELRRKNRKKSYERCAYIYIYIYIYEPVLYIYI